LGVILGKLGGSAAETLKLTGNEKRRGTTEKRDTSPITDERRSAAHENDLRQRKRKSYDGGDEEVKRIKKWKRSLKKDRIQTGKEGERERRAGKSKTSGETAYD